MSRDEQLRSDRPQTQLPEWMRNPEPPRNTVGRRMASFVARQPALRAVRDAWRHWQGRRRWSERHPKTAAALGAVAALVITAVLAVAIWYLFFSLFSS